MPRRKACGARRARVWVGIQSDANENGKEWIEIIKIVYDNNLLIKQMLWLNNEINKFNRERLPGGGLGLSYKFYLMIDYSLLKSFIPPTKQLNAFVSTASESPGFKVEIVLWTAYVG